MPRIKIVIVLFLFSASPAWAYLDPGSVSLWLQGILAGVAVIATTWRFWWFRFKEFVKKLCKWRD